MNIKDKAYDILKGNINRVFIPRWDLLYNALKTTDSLGKLSGLSYYDCSRELGFGIASIRNKAYIERIAGVEQEVVVSGNDTMTKYKTPYGEISTLYRTSAELMKQGVRGLVTEFLIKEGKDIDAALYLIEKTEITDAHDLIAEEIKKTGNDGVVIAQAGYVPYHEFMRIWTGYEQSYFLAIDEEDKVKELLDALANKFDKIRRICLESPADIITVDGHFNTMLMPPYMYENYMFKELKTFGGDLHEKGKFMCSHTDAEMKGFLTMFLNTGFDIAEAYTPPPMTETSLQEAYGAWGDRVTIWGGIASCILSDGISEEDFKNYVEQTLADTENRRFIAGIGDNAPTDAIMPRMAYLAEKFM